MASNRHPILFAAALAATALAAGGVVVLGSRPVDEQSLYVSVLDHGVPVTGLSADNFELTVDGSRRPFTLAPPAPPRIAVVAENTLTLRQDYDRYIPLALEALAQVAPYNGHYLLATIGQRLSVAVPFTSDTSSFNRAYYDSMPTTGWPALWDGVYRAVDLLEPYGGRRAVIVLASGADESSEHTFDDVLTRLARSEVAIFACGIGVGDRQSVHDWRPAGRQLADPELEFRMLTADTGGGSWFPHGQFSIATAIQDIVSRLQHEYRLVFVPDVALDQPSHQVGVRAYRIDADGKRRSLTVIARREWRAPTS